MRQVKSTDTIEAGTKLQRIDDNETVTVTATTADGWQTTGGLIPRSDANKWVEL